MNHIVSPTITTCKGSRGGCSDEAIEELIAVHLASRLPNPTQQPDKMNEHAQPTPAGKPLRYLSVCSGMEAASVAWHPLGWKPVGFSEIEPFPCAILKHRFPDVPNFGDLTRFAEWPIAVGDVDVLIGGTPCQSFSVAGLRKGLEDPRGNLALTFLGLADKVRPRWIVWENVPGVLSSGNPKGSDFACFLAGLGELGYGWAYRVCDAQFYGVPQRRRRVILVATSSGDWRTAAEVLSVAEGVSGYLAKGKQTRKKTSADVRSSVAPSIPDTVGTLCADSHPGCYSGQDAYTGRLIPQAFGGNNTSGPIEVATALTAHGGPHGRQDFASETFIAQGKSHWDGSDVHPTLNQSAKGSGGVGSSNQEIFAQGGAYLVPGDVKPMMFKIRGGVETNSGVQGGEVGKSAGKGFLGNEDQAFTLATTQDQWLAQPITQANVAGPLDAHYYKGPGSRQGGEREYVAQPIPFRKAKRAQSTTDDETWVEGDVSNTLNNFDLGDTRTTHAIVEPIIPIHDMATRHAGKRGDRQDGKGNGLGVGQPGDPMNTLTKGDHHAVAYVAPTIGASGPPYSRTGNERVEAEALAITVQPQVPMAVRRLTPVECERLQGFPDNWSRIIWKGKPEEDCPDGPRYKACGNSMAVPVIAHIGRSIARVDATLNSDA